MIQNPAIQGGGGGKMATVTLTGNGAVGVLCTPVGETDVKSIFKGSFVVQVPNLVVSQHHPVNGSVSVSGEASIYNNKYVCVYGDCSIYVD